MKRYRVTTLDFDTRATILSTPIEGHWAESTKESWSRNKEAVRKELLAEFGEFMQEIKLANFVDLGPRPLSILAFHNVFAAQIRDSFVVGAYYPALVGACALGERILNHLVLSLRDEFRSTPEYKRVHRRRSFANWRLPIEVLKAWNVLLPHVADAFDELNTVRNRAIHFDPATDTNDRALALGAINTLTRIIDGQFGAFGGQPWFIPETRGAAFIARSAESDPFVRKVYLPNCDYVGPWHRPKYMHNGQIYIEDDYRYPELEISDAEFRALLSTSPPPQDYPS